jgi:hypothetical protein
MNPFACIWSSGVAPWRMFMAPRSLATAQGVCLLLWAISPAWAQREMRIRALLETPLPFVTTCVAPAARFAAVDDAAGVLAVGHRPGGAAHVTIVRLDDQGQVAAGEPVVLTLPKPATLGDRANHVLGLACHPRFPLLYVWQDVAPPALPDVTIDPALTAEFDHLLIYGLDQTPPKLLLATARGADFHCGALSSGFALDSAAGRLYVPNMQQPGPMKKPVPAIGWIRIAPDGLPVFDDPNPQPVATASVATSPAAGAAAPAAVMASPEAAASRAARLAAIEVAKASGIMPVLSKYLESPTLMFGDWPCPFSYAPISDDAVLMAGHAGPVSWVLSDRLGRFGAFYLSPYVPYRHRIGAHPKLPAAYLTFVTYDGRILRMELADGYITLAPQTVSLDNTVIHSPPFVLAKTNQVVVGAAGFVGFVDLDEQGRFQAKGQRMTVNNPTVEALAWSERFGKLYVPVEKTP